MAPKPHDQCKKRGAQPRLAHTHPQDGTEIFGDGNTWELLYTLTRKYMKRTYWHYSEDSGLVEDAASDGFMYVYEHWQHQPSSLTTNLARNFAFAIRVARLRSKEFYGKARMLPELPRTGAEPKDLSVNQYGDWLTGIFGECKAPTPEAQHATTDEQQRARAVIKEVLATDADPSWLLDILQGLTQEEAAAERGVSHQAISKRRATGMARISPVLRKHGLLHQGRTSC